MLTFTLVANHSRADGRNVRLLMSHGLSRHIWLSGHLVAWEDAMCHVSSHSLHLGSAVFEAMRCYATESGPAIFRLDDHLKRLFGSAAVYHMPIPFSHEDLKNAVCTTITQNQLSDCYVRVLAFYGPGTFQILPRKCSVEVAVFALPFEPYSSAQLGVKLFVSSWVKFHSSMIPTTAKASGQYVNSLLAITEAAENKCDDALLLNISGRVAEGSGQNVFIVYDGVVITNDQDSSILPGITRDSVIQIARLAGYEIEIRSFSLDELMSADEAFLTGTAVEITPIAEINGNLLRNCPGPCTRRIQQLFADTVSGQNIANRDWLHYVESASM